MVSIFHNHKICAGFIDLQSTRCNADIVLGAKLYLKMNYLKKFCDCLGFAPVT